MRSEPPAFSMASHTADLAVNVYGSDMPGLLANAAHALNSIAFARLDVTPGLERMVRLESVDDDTLLIDWLNELIYMLDAEQTVFSEFHVVGHSTGHAEILCHGEALDLTRHVLAREVKAATYHGAHIRRSAEGYTATVIFDV
jgi:SHS2 domain-containing protein